jgi:hypothetical protein
MRYYILDMDTNNVWKGMSNKDGFETRLEAKKYTKTLKRSVSRWLRLRAIDQTERDIVVARAKCKWDEYLKEFRAKKAASEVKPV